MATINTGTFQRSDRHSMVLAPLGFVVSMAVPGGVIIAGIADQDRGDISWGGAAGWEAVATIAFTFVSVVDVDPITIYRSET